MDLLPDMRDFAKSPIDLRECPVAQHIRQLRQSGYLQESLDLVDRLAMRRITNPQAIIRQGAVFISVGCDINIAIIEVVVRDVPVPSQTLVDFSKSERTISHVLSNPTPCVRT